uniref:Uncharacterized protein n=1 Tax=Pseudo-nitzschia australis TaxID=44445 RepID=A0A7S4AG64_9STRA
MHSLLFDGFFRFVLFRFVFAFVFVFITESERPQTMKRAPSFDLLGDIGGGTVDDSASLPPSYFGNTGAGAGALVPAVNPNPPYPGAPPVRSSYYPSVAQPPMQQQGYPNQAQAAGPSPYGAPVAAPAPQGYPGQEQQYQQQVAPAPPAFAQQQAPAPPAFAQQPQTGYPQQPQQPGAYPAASYPAPTQQY